MQKGASHFHAFVGKAALEMILSTCYAAGLALIFPFVYLQAFSDGASPTVLGAAIALVLVSFFGFLWMKGKLKSALFALSKITLIPGFIGILFSLFGEDVFFAIISKTAPEQAVELLKIYVEQAVPQVRALTISYVILGVLLWWLGTKISSRELSQRVPLRR